MPPSRLFQTWKTLPWLSISLLFGTHFIFGWLLHRFSVTPLIWGITALAVLLQAGVLTLFWRNTRVFFLKRLQSDIGYFVAVLAFASLVVVAVAWIHFFAHVLVMLSSALLARLDTLILKMNQLQAFWLLFTVPIVGLGFSWAVWFLWRYFALAL